MVKNNSVFRAKDRLCVGEDGFVYIWREEGKILLDAAALFIRDTQRNIDRGTMGHEENTYHEDKNHRVVRTSWVYFPQHYEQTPAAIELKNIVYDRVSDLVISRITDMGFQYKLRVHGGFPSGSTVKFDWEAKEVFGPENSGSV